MKKAVILLKNFYFLPKFGLNLGQCLPQVLSIPFRIWFANGSPTFRRRMKRGWSSFSLKFLKSQISTKYFKMMKVRIVSTRFVPTFIITVDSPSKSAKKKVVCQKVFLVLGFPTLLCQADTFAFYLTLAKYILFAVDQTFSVN